MKSGFDSRSRMARLSLQFIQSTHPTLRGPNLKTGVNQVVDDLGWAFWSRVTEIKLHDPGKDANPVIRDYESISF